MLLLKWKTYVKNRAIKGALAPLILLYSHWNTDVYILSFQKTGRTWLRMLLAKAFALVRSDSSANVAQYFVEYSKYAPTPGKKLKVTFTHEDSRDSRLAELERDKRKYRRKKVIFLVRDPRDTIVSAYFEMTKRKALVIADIASFIRNETYGIPKLIAYMNIWAENRAMPASFLLVRYEDLVYDTGRELRRVLEFIGLHDVSDDIVKESVEFARFDRMKELERSLAVETIELQPGDVYDPESFKVRKGKVGGYRDYLSAADVDYVNTRIEQDLAEYFRCYKEEPRNR